MKLPKSFKQYFWDVDFAKIDPKEDNRYIIVRLLEHGNDKAIRWLLKTYQKDSIKEVITKYRGLTAKTANFWADFLNIDLKKVPSLQKPYSGLPFMKFPD